MVRVTGEHRPDFRLFWISGLFASGIQPELPEYTLQIIERNRKISHDRIPPSAHRARARDAVSRIADEGLESREQFAVNPGDHRSGAISRRQPSPCLT